jgi:uncharacterized protein (DUF2141 family)
MRYEYGSQSRFSRPSEMVCVLLMVIAGATLGLPREMYGAVDRGSQGPYTLTVDIEGVVNSRGVVGVLVFSSAAGWPERASAALTSKAVPAREGLTELLITGLDEGDYAVVVLHDENENRKLDRNRLHLPVEQWGMSNNPKHFLSAPSFSEASFRLEGDKWIRVRLN